MEWCRMFSLRIVVCTLLLGGGLSSPLGPDTSNSTSRREQKRQELLKMLEEYSPSSRNALSPVENTFKHDLPPSSLPKTTENPSVTNGDTEESVKFPDMEGILTYRDYMERIYGTQEGVDFLKRDFGPTGLDRARAMFGKKINRNREDARLANIHYNKVHQRTKCRVPVLQLVRVRDHYPDPSKDYMPECTLLHRCSDSTSCCSKGQHCVPKKIQEVPLYFFNIHPGMSETVKLFFENHTECECKAINDLPRLLDERNPTLLDRNHSPSTCHECPVPFTSRTYKDGRCGCDCFDRQKPCLRIKRGKEPLPEIERRCVQANHCHIPECEHGHYNTETGRCPLRHDETPRKHHRHHQPPHRWAFLERD